MTPAFDRSAGAMAPSRLASIDRRAGRLLRALRDRDLLRRPGDVRLGDYVIERLGVSYRTAQEWIRIDEALERLPLVSAALDSGEIGSAKVRLLARVATEEDEARWVDLAKRVDVRGLARAVAERQCAGRSDGMEARAGDEVEGLSGGERAGDEVTPNESDERDKGASPRPGATVGGPTQSGIIDIAGLDEEEEEVKLSPLEMSVPAWLAASWREAVVFARQLAGAAMSRGECFEMVVAELLASLEPETETASKGGGRAVGGVAQESTDLPTSAHDRQEVEGAGRPLSVDGHRRSDLDSQPAGTPGSADDPAAPGTHDAELPRSSPDSPRTTVGSREPLGAGSAPAPAGTRAEARAIDKELRELMAARQRREWALAERLRGAAMLRSYRLDGLASLEAYARERLGLSPRATYRLLALHRTLERLPRLRRSFLSGRVTLRQALVIGSVATVVTERAWVARARSVTLRRLEDEVCFWKHLKEVRPSVWELLEEYPLPAGIVLVPGRPARLSTSSRQLRGEAQEEGGAEAEMADADAWDRSGSSVSGPNNGDDLPTFAPGARLTNQRMPTCARGDASTTSDPVPREADLRPTIGDLSTFVPGARSASHRMPRSACRDASASGDVLSVARDLRSAGSDLPTSAPGTGSTCHRLPTSVPIRGARLTAEALLQALEDAEGALPLPEHRVCLRLRVEPDVKALWESAVARCRSTIGETITDWEVLALALAAFWKTWDNKETGRQRREHRTIDRDGWRCMAPGCWSMGTGRLHEHHIIYKSHGGAPTDPRNVLAACTQHHKRLLHEGFIRCTGDAPDDVVWSFGVEEGQEPFLLYHGETRVGGTAV